MLFIALFLVLMLLLPVGTALAYARGEGSRPHRWVRDVLRVPPGRRSRLWARTLVAELLLAVVVLVAFALEVQLGGGSFVPP